MKLFSHHIQQPSRGVRVFAIIWFGQLISLLGTELTDFALGIWVYQRTESVTQYALILVFAVVPGIMIAPIAGVFVDRWDRRWVMILSDCGAAVSTLVIAFLIYTNRIAVWHIYLATAAASIFNAFQEPAYIASITLLVPKKHLGRASGMREFAQGIAKIASPVIAGVLIVMIGIWGVILIDFVTFLFAVGTLFCIRIPRPEITSEGEESQGLWWQEAVTGWKYIAARSGLLGLLLFYVVINFTAATVLTLITPLVLSFASPITLGTIASTAGVGMLLGSIVMTVWGGPTHRVAGILGLTLFQGILLIIGGVQPSVVLIALAAFFYLFVEPIIIGSDQVLWQCKVAPDMQGRVFAIQRIISSASLPFAAFVAGPLADYVFEPLLAVDGPLAGNVGKVIGVGQGRGIGLLFMVMGACTMVATVAAYLHPRIRLVEQELPDLISDETPPET